MPGPNNASVAANNAPADDFLSNINDIIDSDADMYDGDEGDGTADTGTDSVDADSGSGDVPAGPVPREAPQARTPNEEPDLPMQLPQQQRPQPQYDPENPRGYQRIGNLFADDKGNIVTRDGRIMAAAGEPARHWTNMSRAASQVGTLQRQNEALTRERESQRELIDRARELVELPNSLGISRDDYNLGVQLIAAWNRDPLTVCRDMVARTMARGHNATDILGKEAGNAIEMSALRQLINEATAGQRQREEQDRTVATQRTEAEQKYNAFMTRYPDAAPHADAIANFMRENRMSAEEAYHEIRYFALQHGFDFSQPLGPQVAARQAQERMQPQQPNGRTQRAPMVNGGGGGNRDHLTTQANYADANASWSEILDDVMRRTN